MERKNAMPGNQELHKIQSEFNAIKLDSYSRAESSLEKLLDVYEFEKNTDHADVQNAAIAARESYLKFLESIKQFEAHADAFPAQLDRAQGLRKDVLFKMMSVEQSTGLTLREE